MAKSKGEAHVPGWSPKSLAAAGAIGLAAITSPPAQAETYPSRAVTLVVPYTAGGGTDLFARLVGQKLEQRLGKPFIIENRPGSGAVVAATMVAHAPPDGHTLIMASSTPMALNVTVRKSLPYDPTVDLAPIALVARVPFVLLVHPDLPVHSVDDLVRLAREKPGRLVYGSSGIGTFHHLNAELFKSTFGLDIVHVPYRGTLPTLNDLVGGHIAMSFSDLPPALPLIQAGKVRALGVTTAQRVPAAPDIPPLAEVGIPGYDASSWQMVATQGKTPPEIIARLHQEIRAVMQDETVQKDLVRDGAIPQLSAPPEELKAFVRSEIVRWGKVIERAGIAGSE